jgi:hypothetical protein
MAGASGIRATAWLAMSVAGLALTPLLVGWSSAAAQDSSAHVSATMREGRVTLSARDVSLRDALTEFSRASGIEIYLETSVTADESTTIAFDGMPPEDGLRRLLRAKNFIFVYSGGSLAEVHTYTEGRNELRRLPTDARVASIPAPPRPPPRSGRPALRPDAENPGAAQSESASTDAERQEGLRLRAQALGDPDPDERAAGLDELAAGDNEQLALETAARVLETERVSDVLQSALNVFGGVDTAPLEPILAFVNANRVQDAAVRIRALSLLSDRGQADPRVRELMIMVARSDRDREVRELAQILLEDLTKD